MNILIAEDHSTLQKVIVKIIKKHFGGDTLNLHIANNGNEALEILRNHDIDLMTSDINMPLKSGLDVLKELRTGVGTLDKNQNIPVIIISAYEPSYVEKYKSLQFADIFTKPFDVKTLVDSINRIISSPNDTKDGKTISVSSQEGKFKKILEVFIAEENISDMVHLSLLDRYNKKIVQQLEKDN